MLKILVKPVNKWRIGIVISTQVVPLFLKFSHRVWSQTSCYAPRYQNLSEYFSTINYAFLYLLSVLFYSLSTLPTIKTTNYINNFIGDYT